MLLYLLLGAAGMVCAVLQALAAEGRVQLRSWPFVQTPSRALRWAYAVGMLAISLLVIGLGLLA